MILITINILFTAIFLSCFISCTSFPRLEVKTIPLHWDRKDNAPALVILPFDNNTDDIDINIMFRKYFAEYVNSKHYRDLNLAETDEALNTLQLSLGKQWKTLTPMELGKLFHSDFLIYGEVNRCSRIYLGFYAQNTLGVHIKMVETRYGQPVWNDAAVVRSHQGGIPFSLFGLIPKGFRCNYHMTEEQKIALIETTRRELIEQMPNPLFTRATVFTVEIQVALYNRKEHAEDAIKELQARGYSARMEKVTVGFRKWYRVILGPYYDKAEAELIKKVIAKDQRYQPIFIHY